MLRKAVVVACIILQLYFNGAHTSFAQTDEMAEKRDFQPVFSRLDTAFLENRSSDLESLLATLAPHQDAFDQEEKALYALYKGYNAFRKNNNDEARNLANNAIYISSNKETDLKGHILLNYTFNSDNSHNKAFRTLEAISQLANSINNIEWSIRAIYQELFTYRIASLYDPGLRVFKSLLEKAQDADSSRYICFAYHEMGYLEVSTGNLSAGLDYFEKALPLCEQSGHLTALASTRAGYARALIHNAQPDAALAQLQHVLKKGLESAGNVIVLSYANAHIALAYLALQNSSAALPHALEALELSNQFSGIYTQRFAYEALYKIAKAEERFSDALAYHEKYLEAQQAFADDQRARQTAYQQIRFESVRKDREIAALNQQNRVLSLENRVTRQERRQLYVLIASVAVILFLLSLMLVRTRRQNARIRDLASEADRANRAKSDFLATMSHELRTPLNAVLGYSEILRDEIMGPLGSDAYREYAGSIHASGRHLLDLINDVLDLARIESGRYTPVDTHVDMQEVLDRIQALVQPRVEAKAQSFSTRIDGHEFTLIADERAVVQILLNLVWNAVKYTPEGGDIRVSVTFNGGCRITVTDTGPGIPKAEQKRIFEPFQRGSDSATTATEGTGIGLALTRRLIAAHGATLVLDSAPGRGTTVIVRFPPERVRDPDSALERRMT